MKQNFNGFPVAAAAPVGITKRAASEVTLTTNPGGMIAQGVRYFVEQPTYRYVLY